jgi:uncharacterized protein
VCGLRERALSDEVPIAFEVAGSSRIGIVHLPASDARYGVLIIVGGWQYRVGSHRQFVLLGRALAAAGIATMRFDSRGMGDSQGDPGAPEPAEHLAPDIRAALDSFAKYTPGVVDFTSCGLCDGASAALMYAPLVVRHAGARCCAWAKRSGSICRRQIILSHAESCAMRSRPISCDGYSCTLHN